MLATTSLNAFFNAAALSVAKYPDSGTMLTGDKLFCERFIGGFSLITSYALTTCKS